MSGGYPSQRAQVSLTPAMSIEYESIRPTVEAEIMKIAEARKRSAEEEAYRRRRDDVEQHYNRLKSAEKDKVIPNLVQFRQLPIISVLQSKKSTTTGVASDLQNSQLVAELLQGDLRKWRESASMALGATLGFPNWRSASKKKLHPVYRLTARFRCKKCEREGHKFYEEGCLDFAGACAHVCRRPDMKKRAREKWTPDQFEKDEKVHHTFYPNLIFLILHMGCFRLSMLFPKSLRYVVSTRKTANLSGQWGHSVLVLGASPVNQRFQ